jgi:hypothetical protein
VGDWPLDYAMLASAFDFAIVELFQEGIKEAGSLSPIARRHRPLARPAAGCPGLGHEPREVAARRLQVHLWQIFLNIAAWYQAKDEI